MHIFFESWESVIRTLVITIAAYIGLIVMLRISGNRTLSKMNAFDYIVTIALGSSFAAVALNKSIALIDGLLVFILLIGMQFIIASLSVRFPLIKHTITGEPVLILYKGEFLDEILRKERITKSDVIAKVCEKGFSNLEDVDAVVLETTGDLSFIKHIKDAKATTLNEVECYKSMSDKD